MDEILIKYKADITDLKAAFEEIKQGAKQAKSEFEDKPPKFEIKNLEELKRALKQIGAASGEVWDSEKFNAQINKAVNDSKKLGEIKKELLKVAEGVDKTSDEFKILQATIAGVDKQIENLGQQNSKGFLSGLIDKTKQGFSDLGSKMSEYLNPATAVVGAGTAIAGVFYKMISVNTEFQQSLAELQSITGVTTKDLEFYRNQAREIAQDKTLSSSLSETVNAFKLVGSAKPDLLANKEALAEVTRQAILLSKASGDSLESSVNSLTGTLNQFNLGAEESARVIDILAAGSKAGAVAIPDLSAGLEKFGAVAKANNVTVEQAVALQETLGDKQIKGAEAGTQLRNIILKLANSGRGFVNGQFDINAALEQTSKEFKNIQDPVKRSQELTKLFGLESVTAGQILLDNIGQFNKYTTAVSEQGVALTQAKTNTQTFQGALTRLSNSFEALLAGGGSILNIFTPIVDVIAEALPYIGNFFTALGNGISTFFSESQYVAQIGDLFMALWDTIKEVGGAIIDVFAEILGSFGVTSNGASIFAKAFDIAMSSIRSAIEYVLLAIRTFKDVLVGTLQIIKLQVQTFVDFWSAIFRGDFKGAVGVVGDYIKGLSTIFDNTFGKIKNNLIDFVKGMLKIVEPFASMFNIDINKLNKNLDKAKTVFATSAKQVQKEQQKNLSTAGTNTTSSVTAEAQAVEGKAGKGGKKIDYKKEAEKAEKEYNDAKLKERDAALKKVSDLEVRKQKELIAKLEATGANKNQIEEEKIKLLEAEQKYNNQILAIRSSFANQLKDKYTETKQKELDAVIEGNKKIQEEEAKIGNERTKLEISQAFSQKDPRTEQLENLKKRLQEQTGLTIEDENKRKLEILRIDQEIILSKARNNEKAIQDALRAGADYDGEAIQNALKANVELNNQLIANNKARLGEEQKQEKEAAEQRKALLKQNLDELFAFAQNGLLLQLGIDPQALAKIKSDVENAIKVFNDPKATDQQKMLAGAQAAQSAVVAGIDMIRASERAAAEEKIAEINQQEEAELKAAEGNEQKQAIIRQKAEQKRKEVKRKEFEADKRASITKAIINTAVEIAKVAATPFLIPIVAAIGAAQVALIASQPIPKFKDGVIGFNGVVGGVGTGTSDSNLAYLSKGESVIPAQATGQNLGLVTSLVNGDVEKYINKHYILPAIEAKEAEVMQVSQKRIDDVENKIINRTIAKTLDAMRKDNKINTSEIVTAIKKDKFTL
jgi:TP901 family phage tail tape measure protein